MRILSFIVLAITGLGLALPGLYLAVLGGSFYYIVAGLLVLLSAWLILSRDHAGTQLLWLVLLGTVIWSLWEVGLDGWALMPRLVYLAILALVVWLLSRIGGAERSTLRPVLSALVVILAVVATAATVWAAIKLPAGPAPTQLAAVTGTNDGEWTHYGKTQAGTRYSRLAQITPANAANLEQAWVYRSGVRERGKLSADLLQATPLMVDGMLYGCTGYNAVFALDPVTGKEIWRHDPKINPSLGNRGVCRGVSFFRTPDATSECPARLLLGTADNRLIALDAKTGRPCTSFGNNGAADLRDGLGDFLPGWSNPTSPPTIVRGTAVIGAFVVDNQSVDVPPGVIRGYDAVTGQIKWAFDPGRPDDPTPAAPGKPYTPSTPNSWTIFSGDEALGLVYVPMGNGSPDYYGAHRTPETDRFTSAVVALDAETGAVRWTFQAIHRDLWDYDLGSQPVLVDFPTANGTAPGLILPTKTGQIFVLDRRTGKPLTKVEERPVPASDIPGERSSPTQPFSTEFPDFSGGTLTEADMWGMTPFDQLYCRILFKTARYQGMYTPLRVGPSIRTPGELGGIDWGSVSVDEDRGIMIVNHNLMADWDELIPREQADKENIFPRATPRALANPYKGSNAGAMEGTPYAIRFTGFITPKLGIPCQRPPYGYITAVELKTRKVLWQHPFGNASNSGPFNTALGLPFTLGAPNMGGSIVTAGGVIFIGASQDGHFRAIDEASGKELWKVKLPAGGHATPMTYLGKDGKQYVVIAAGGSGGFRTGSSDSFVAYRLKQ